MGGSLSVNQTALLAYPTEIVPTPQEARGRLEAMLGDLVDQWEEDGGGAAEMSRQNLPSLSQVDEVNGLVLVQTPEASRLLSLIDWKSSQLLQPPPELLEAMEELSLLTALEALSDLS